MDKKGSDSVGHRKITRYCLIGSTLSFFTHFVVKSLFELGNRRVIRPPAQLFEGAQSRKEDLLVGGFGVGKDSAEIFGLFRRHKSTPFSLPRGGSSRRLTIPL